MRADFPGLMLEAKRVAGLIGRSEHTLKIARRSNPTVTVNMPPHTVVGKRAIRYRLIDVIRWAEFRGIQLRWEALPLHQRADRVTAEFMARAVRANEGVPPTYARHLPAGSRFPGQPRAPRKRAG